MLIEPTNPVVETDAYPTTWDDAIRTVEAVDHPDLSLLYDTYHRYLEQTSELGENDTPQQGAVTEQLRAGAGYTDAIHLADVPDRCRLQTGTIDFDGLFEVMAGAVTVSSVCCEYQPEIPAVLVVDQIRRSLQQDGQ